MSTKPQRYFRIEYNSLNNTPARMCKTSLCFSQVFTKQTILQSRKMLVAHTLSMPVTFNKTVLQSICTESVLHLMSIDSWPISVCAMLLYSETTNTECQIFCFISKQMSSAMHPTLPPPMQCT